MKTMFIICALVLSVALAGNVMAFGDCGGEPCTDVTASALPNSAVHQAIIAPDSTSMNGGKAVGDFIVGGEAQASGRDTVEFVGYEYSGDGEKGDPGWYRHKWGWTQYKHGGTNGRSWTFLGTERTAIYETIAGEAKAFGITDPTMTSSVDIFTNGKQFNSGLSYSFVKSTSELDISGEVSARGTDGCLQTAEIFVEGSLGAYAYGGSYVEGPNGSYASANGWGQTTVSFSGFESDQSTYGFLWFPNEAYVDFDSTVNVDQSILNLSYVSPDGTTAANFAFVGGGSAELDRGRDGLFGQDNVYLTGIEATGAVAQNAMATNGYGAFAYGGSSAYFSGAVGQVNSTRGWCGPDQIATVGGMAVVGGYNNVTSSPGSLTVTSKQFGYATTGNSGAVVD
jgi:hypothetical protein